MSSLIFYGIVRSMVQVWGNSASPGNTGSFVVAICFDFGHALGLTVIYKFKAVHGHLRLFSCCQVGNCIGIMPASLKLQPSQLHVTAPPPLPPLIVCQSHGWREEAHVLDA